MNIVILTGRLTRNLKLSNAGDTTFTHINIAIRNRRSPDDKPTFTSVTAFGQLAELCSEHLVKGQQVEVRGRVSTREVTLEDGRVIEVPSLIADEVEFGMKPRRKNSGEEE